MRSSIFLKKRYTLLSLGMVSIILVTATVGGALALPIVVYALPPALIRGVTIAEIIITLLSGAGTVPVAPTMTAPIANYQTTDFDYESLISEGVITSNAPTIEEAIEGVGSGQWAYDYDLSELTTKLGNNWQAMADAGYDSFLALEGAVNEDLNGIDVLGRILTNVANTGYMGLENTVAIITLPDKVIRAGFDLFARAFKNVFGNSADSNIPLQASQQINFEGASNQNMLTRWELRNGKLTNVMPNRVRSFDKGLACIIWYEDNGTSTTGNFMYVNATDNNLQYRGSNSWPYDSQTKTNSYDATATTGVVTVPANSFKTGGLDWWYNDYPSGYEGNIINASNRTNANTIKDSLLNGETIPVVNPNVTNEDGFINTENPVNENPAIGENQALSPINWNDYQTYITDTNNNYTNNNYNIQGDTYINYITPYVNDVPEVVPTQPPVIPDQPTIDPKPSIAPEMQEAVLSGTSPNLTTKFPFCLPFDLVNSFKVLEEEAKAPSFEWNMKIDRFDIDETIEIDMEPFTPVAEILRILLLLGFIVGLILLTRQIIGA